MRLQIGLLIVLLALCSLSFSVDVSSCPNIVSNDTYTLTANLVGAPNSNACVRVSASNVTLDCNGYNITNNVAGTTYGIMLVNVRNVTVKSCPAISNYTYGVELSNANISMLINSTAYNNTQYAIYLTNSNNNSLVNNTAYNQSRYAGFYFSNSNNNTLTNNTAYSNNHSFYFSSSSTNNLTNNNASNGGFYGFYFYYSNNNTLYGNLAYNNSRFGFYIDTNANNNSLINNTAQENGYYDLFIVPSSASSCNNIIENLTGSGNRPVRYAKSAATWSNMDASEVILCNADNSVLNNISINGSDTLKNNAFILFFTDNASINNTNSANNYVGIIVNASSGNVFFNNTMFNHSGDGINVCNANNNLFVNNTINMTSFGIELAWYGCGSYTSRNNTFVNNTITRTTATSISINEESNNSFMFNDISHTPNWGIAFPVNSTFINNTIYNTTFSAMSLGDNNTVINNTITRVTNSGYYGIEISAKNNNIIANNLVSNVTGSALYICCSNPSVNNTIANNTFRFSNYGIYDAYSGANLFINNTAYNNTYGFEMDGSNCILSNNTAFNNSYGLRITQSSANNTTVSDMHLYRNKVQDFYINMYAGRTVLISNMTFDSPAGNYTNYTTLSITDVFESNIAYYINHAPNPFALPSNYTSFNQKFVNISGAVSIDTIVWSWPAVELIGYNENAFGLWNYSSGSWSNTSAVLNTTAHTLSLTNMSSAATTPYGILQYNAGGPSPPTPVTSCTNITSAGFYNLTANLSGAPNPVFSGAACLMINASNVVLNCAGYNITNNVAGTTYGIALNASATNVTVKNCPRISNYTIGIEARSNGNFFINNTVSSSSQYGFFLNSSSNNNLTNNTASNSSQYGFYLHSSSNNNLTSNTASNGSQHGFYIFSGSSNNTFINNTAFNQSGTAFYFSQSRASNLSGNNATLSGNGYLLVSTSSVNFTGPNYVSGAFATGSDMYIDTSSVVNTNYSGAFHNLTTEFITVAFANATGVKMKSMTNTSAGAPKSGLCGANVCTLITNNNNVMNITDLGPGNIANLSIYYNASGQTNLSRINIAKYNASGWQVLGQTAINNSTGFVTYGPVSGFTPFAVVNTTPSGPTDPTNVSSCTNISSAGEYVLNANLSGANISVSPLSGNACIKIASSNVTLDCAGYNITNNGTGGTTYGILLSSSLVNVTVRNCQRISEYTYGIYINTSNGSSFVNNTIYNISGTGIRVYSGYNNTLANSTVYNNGAGIIFDGGSNNTITNNTVYNNSWVGINFYYSSNNTITNNTVYRNIEISIFVHYGSNNTLANNTAYNNSYGFSIVASDRNNLANNTAYNTTYGFFISPTYSYWVGPSPINSTLANNTAYNNTYGIYINSSTNNTLANNILYNNSIDLGVDSSVSFNMTSTLFLNPSGTLVNYTNLSINDSTGASEGYAIKWSRNSSAPPTGYFSFAQKFLNITNLTAGVSIDRIVWHWTDADVALQPYYNDSKFELWKYNTTWKMLNDTPDFTNNALSLASMNPASIYGILQNNVSNCPVVASSGTYTQDKNFTGAPNSVSPLTGTACLKIAASNVVWNCNGFNITNNGTGGTTYGILVTGSLTNVTVKNCPGISNYSYGVYVYTSNNSNITNNSAYNNSQNGFHLESSSNNTLANNRAYNNSVGGFYLKTNSNNNTFTNNSAYNDQHGFYVYLSSSNNTFTNNSAYSNTQNGFGIESSSNNNILINNSAYNNSQCGIYQYQSNNSILTGNVFSSNRDFYASGYYGAVHLEASSNNKLTNNTAYNNSYRGFYTSFSSNNTFTNNTAYNNSEYGFYLYIGSLNNTLTNNRAYNNSYGIALLSSNNNTLANNTAYNNSQSGIYFDSSSNNTLTNNSAYNNTQYGIILTVCSNNTLLSNSAFNNSQSGIYFSSSSNSILANNSAYKNLYGIYLYASANNNTLLNNSAWNNTQSGIYLQSNSDNNRLANNTASNNTNGLQISSSNNTTVSNMHLYSNTVRDFYISTDGTARTAFISNMTVDNPVGNFTNHTALNISDIINANSAYEIKWTANYSALPTGYFGFAQKFVNITGLTTGVSIDSVVWHWTNAEVASQPYYNESMFELWKYNGTWNNAAATLDTGANTLSLTSMNPASIYGILQNNASNCPVISSSGAYYQTIPFTDHPNIIPDYGYMEEACIIINASDVTYDCRGYLINNTAFDYGPISVRGIVVVGPVKNVTIKNCRINGYDHGITIYAANDSIFSNNTITDMFFSGINLAGCWAEYGTNCYNNTFTGNSITYSGIAFAVDPGSNLTAFYNNTADYGQAGFDLYGYGATLVNNTAYGNSYNGIIMEELTPADAIINNTLQENVLSDLELSLADFSAENCHATVSNNLGSGGRPIGYYDYAVSLSGQAFSELILCGADDAVLDNVTVVGSDAFYNNYLHAILSDNLTIRNSYLYGNYDGIVLLDTNATLINNTAEDNGDNFAMVFSFPAGSATLINNTASAGGLGFRGGASTGAHFTLINNTAFNNSGIYILVQGSNGTLTLINNSAYNEGAIFFGIATMGGGEEGSDYMPGYGSNWTFTVINNTAHDNGPEWEPERPFGAITAIFIRNSSALLQGNLAYNSHYGSGFLVVGSENVTLLSNIAHDNDEFGFYIINEAEEGGGPYFYGYGSGITSDAGPSNLMLINNTAYLNGYAEGGYGQGAFSEGGGFAIFGSSGNNLTGNLADNNTVFGFGLFTNDSILANNTAKDNIGFGFYLERSENNVLDANDAYGNFVSGFTISGTELGGGTNNTLIHNRACNNMGGITVIADDNNTLSDNTICNSSLGALIIASGTTLSRDQFYNNMYDIEVVGANNDSTISFTDVIFDNPNGDMADFTNLSMNDTFGESEGYVMVWSQQPAPLPAIGADSYLSFGNKFINVTTISLGEPDSSSVVLDNVVWSWDSEAAGYDESKFSLWSYNQSGDTWTQLNDTPDTDAHVLSFEDLPANPYSVENGSANYSTFAILYYTANVSVNKTANTTEAQSGENATFTIDVLNPGSLTINVSVIDVLPEGVTFRGATITPTSVVDQVVTWEGAFIISPGDSDTIIYNVSASAPGTYTNNVTAIGVPPIGDSVSDNSSASFTVTKPSEAGGKQEEEKPLSLSFSSTCEGNVVTVKSSGDPVSGVAVKLNGDSISSTNSSGQVSFDGCGMTDFIIYISKSGYRSVYKSEDTVPCEQCAVECVDNSDCPASYECEDSKCVPVECKCGKVQDHMCVPYACCDDKDCADTEYCAPGGTCEEVTGKCGQAISHRFVPYGYECGSEPGCPVCPGNKICTNHTCALPPAGPDVTCPATGFVGDNKTCMAKTGDQPCKSCDYVVTDPTGRNYSGKTDAGGSFGLPLGMEGTYKVTVFQDGQPVKTIQIKSLPRAAPEEPEKPTEAPGIESYMLWLLLLLVLAVLAVIYWRSREGKKVAPPEKQAAQPENKAKKK